MYWSTWKRQERVLSSSMPSLLCSLSLTCGTIKPRRQNATDYCTQSQKKVCHVQTFYNLPSRSSRITQMDNKINHLYSAFSKTQLPPTLQAGTLLQIASCIPAFSTRGKWALGPLLSAPTGADKETPTSNLTESTVYIMFHPIQTPFNRPLSDMNGK